MKTPITGIGDLKTAVATSQKVRRQAEKDWRKQWKAFRGRRFDGTIQNDYGRPLDGRVFDFSVADFALMRGHLKRKGVLADRVDMFVRRMQYPVQATAEFMCRQPFGKWEPWSGQGEARKAADIVTVLQDAMDGAHNLDGTLVKGEDNVPGVRFIEQALDHYTRLAEELANHYPPNHDGKKDWSRDAVRQLILRASMIWLDLFEQAPGTTEPRPNRKGSPLHEICSWVLGELGISRKLTAKDIKWARVRIEHRGLHHARFPGYAIGFIPYSRMGECFDDDYDMTIKRIWPGDISFKQD